MVSTEFHRILKGITRFSILQNLLAENSLSEESSHCEQLVLCIE